MCRISLGDARGPSKSDEKYGNGKIGLALYSHYAARASYHPVSLWQFDRPHPNATIDARSMVIVGQLDERQASKSGPFWVYQPKIDRFNPHIYS